MGDYIASQAEQSRHLHHRWLGLLYEKLSLRFDMEAVLDFLVWLLQLNRGTGLSCSTTSVRYRWLLRRIGIHLMLLLSC